MQPDKPTAIKPEPKIFLYILCILTTLSLPAAAQVNNPAYDDYFLVGRFGEICTMCEAIVLCEAGDNQTSHESIPEDRDFMLYHLQTRTFWSQVSTIWEWFIANFNSDSLAAAGHSRPARVYTVKNNHWSGPRIVEARVSLEPATIVIEDQTIDRIDRQWLRGTINRPVGYCQRLPLWESLDIINEYSRTQTMP
jgi:hypothetical protein